MPVLFRSEWTSWYLTSVAICSTWRGTYKKQLAIQVQEKLPRSQQAITQNQSVSKSQDTLIGSSLSGLDE